MKSIGQYMDGEGFTKWLLSKKEFYKNMANDKFPNKYNERPIFKNEYHDGNRYETLIGFESWHSENPQNKIFEKWQEHNQRHIDEKKEYEETNEWTKRNNFFEDLKNNIIGSVAHEKKIVEFIDREDKEIRLNKNW